MKLIAIDLDETLLSTDCTISQGNIDSIREAQEQGNIIAISSGRSFHDIKQILQNADLGCPIIAGNGAISLQHGTIIHKLTLPISVVIDMMAQLEENDSYYEIYTKNGIFIKQNGKDTLVKEIMDWQNPISGITKDWAYNEIDIQYSQYGLLSVPDFNHIDFTDLEVYKIFVLPFDNCKLNRLRELFKQRGDISVTISGIEKIDMGHLESSKGSALKKVAQYFGVPLEDTVAIGDNLNDLSMFQTAGMSIAMGNAVDELRKRATYITKDHNDNGIAYAFREYILA